MAQIAAGLLMCRKENNELQFFLVHPGGPFYVKKNEGVWSIPKGIPENNEELLQTAQREFQEETGIQATGPFHSLGSIKQKSGKIVHGWAFKGTWTSDQGITSNIFKLEWPPRSKKFIDVPEVDRAEWMSYTEACKMIHPNQLPFLTKARAIYESDTSFTP
jgi:predicted NUDIX family NTP pyrophosphohydrolase